MECEKTTQTCLAKRGDSGTEKPGNTSRAFDMLRHVVKGSESYSQIPAYNEMKQHRSQQLDLDIWQNLTIEHMRSRMI